MFHFTWRSLVHHWLSHFGELHRPLVGILCSSRIISQKTVSARYGSVSVKASLKWFAQGVELTLFRDGGRKGHLWECDYFIRVEFWHCNLVLLLPMAPVCRENVSFYLWTFYQPLFPRLASSQHRHQVKTGVMLVVGHVWASLGKSH